jgi:hypothetical protein
MGPEQIDRVLPQLIHSNSQPAHIRICRILSKPLQARITAVEKLKISKRSMKVGKCVILCK